MLKTVEYIITAKVVVGDYNYLDTDCKANQKPQQPSKGKKIINVFENFHLLEIQLKYKSLFFFIRSARLFN